MQDHEQIESLAYGYVLLALEPDEREAFEAHLAECDLCARQVAEMRAVADALAFLAEEREPPPRLKERILSEIRDESDGSAAMAALAPPPRFRWRLTAQRAAAIAVIAILLAAVAGLAFWTAQLQTSVEALGGRVSRSYEAIAIMGQAEQWWSLEEAESAPGSSGLMAHSSRRGAACLMAFDLPPAQEGSEYYAWGLRDGVPTNLGNMWPLGDGLWRIIPGDLAGIDQIEITMEADGPSPSPEGPVLATFRLNSD